jgi:hypothetical protein
MMCDVLMSAKLMRVDDVQMTALNRHRSRITAHYWHYTSPTDCTLNFRIS